MTAPAHSSNPLAAALEGAARQVKRARRWANNHAVRSRVSAACGTEVRTITTYTHPDELVALYQWVSLMPTSTHALEIGSHLGASSCFIGAALLHRPGATLVCVDTWNNETMPEGQQDTMATFQSHTRGLSQVIRPVRKRSEHLVREDVPCALGYVFIDGDHSYEGCRTDFEKVKSWVVPGGIIAFHDAVDPTFPGVARVIGEALASGQWAIGRQVRSLFSIVRRGEVSS